jgi:hypothetical protein
MNKKNEVMKNTFKNKKVRMSAKADIRKRNEIGAEAMWEEIEARWRTCDEEVLDYVTMGREYGEHIDYEAVEDMCVRNAENDIVQIKYKYLKRGLPEELCEF